MNAIKDDSRLSAEKRQAAKPPRSKYGKGKDYAERPDCACFFSLNDLDQAINDRTKILSVLDPGRRRFDSIAPRGAS